MNEAAARQRNPFVPERFAKEIGLHLAKNYCRQGLWESPLILGIHGPPGEGKTFICQRILENYGIRSWLIAGGELENADAGEPSSLIRRRYLEASRAMKHGDVGSCLILNDIDAALGDWGSLTQYTVNRQNVLAQLLHLSDFPTVVENQPTIRVPIIVTANDLTKLYGPLVRPGRMKRFEWKPTIEEKTQIVASIFPEYDQPSILRLVDEFRRQPASFFADLRASALDGFIWTAISGYQPKDLIKVVRNQQFSVRLPADISYLSKLAARIEAELQMVNHLGDSIGSHGH